MVSSLILIPTIEFSMINNVNANCYYFCGMHKSANFLITSLISLLLFAACSPLKRGGTNVKDHVVTVMSYNVHHCNPPSKPGLIDVDAVAAAIRKQNPDIVALQEIDVNTNRSGKINQAVLLSEKTGLTSFTLPRPSITMVENTG